MNTLRLYWSSSLKAGKKNFGDWLSPALCQHLSGCEVVHAPPNQCDLVGIGSILQRVKHRFWNRKTRIWGSGFIAQQPQVAARHHYHAVRGKLTAALIKGAEIEAFGDPGLLVNQLLPGHAGIAKRHRVGIIPHYKDQANAALPLIAGQFDDSTVLDVFADTQAFLEQVAACEFVLSSSLHGLVVADAFGIPNAWIKLSDAVRGEDFKFLDYYSVFGLAPAALAPAELTAERLPALRESYQRPGLAAIQSSLLAAFPFRRERAAAPH